MPRTARFLVLVGFVLGPLALLPWASVQAEEEQPPAVQPGDTITWVNDVAKAFERAAEKRLPVMICINSRRVDGGKEEPAAKGLREVIYLDTQVVAKSRKFVCVFLTSEGSSADYGELRARFGIEGTITSPQHIFSHPDHQQGEALLERKEYWPYGKGDGAIKSMLELMDNALAAFHKREGTAQTPTPEGGDGPVDPAPEAPIAPGDDAERAAWIAKLIAIVRSGDETTRREALRSLLSNDKDGDCTKPVIALIPEYEKEKDEVARLVDIVRALGVPQLFEAAHAMDDLLKHKDDSVRANVAVSLEYIGCPESAKSLEARADREKEENIANHMFRALGRCGAGEAKVRETLLKNVKGAKSELASYGPIVGLAYFHKDAKAARGVEKLLQAMGPPGGGRRGGGQGTMKRALLAWTLSQIEDPKSAEFMREKMLKPLDNMEAWWIGAVAGYYSAIARKCEGDAEAEGEIDEGIRRTLEFAGGTGEIMDAARKDRDRSRFEPKADWEVEGRDGGMGDPRGGGRKR
ncbi:MAG: hypothetical protein O2894_02820 [Planctomycetota bacterium]|nr:hypothetical protein [Planctomycetota bacterium]